MRPTFSRGVPTPPIYVRIAMYANVNRADVHGVHASDIPSQEPGREQTSVSRRTLAIVALAALAVTTGAAPAAAHAASPAPTTIQLPAGFQPEGIAIGRAPFAYFGSRATGDIYRASLRTGAGQVISKGPGTPSLGLKLDRRGRLFVAGGSGGNARVVDVSTGAVLTS